MTLVSGSGSLAVAHPVTTKVVATSAAMSSFSLLGGYERVSGLIETASAVPPGFDGGALVTGPSVAGLLVGGSANPTRAGSGGNGSGNGSGAGGNGAGNGSGDGHGCAVPIATAASVAGRIEDAARKASHRSSSASVHLGRSAFLGALFGVLPVTTYDVTGVHSHPTYGLVVEMVLPGSPAAKALVERGDVVYSFDKTPMNTLARFTHRLESARPGDTVQVSFVDQRRLAKDEHVTLTSGPALRDSAGSAGSSGSRPACGVPATTLRWRSPAGPRRRARFERTIDDGDRARRAVAAAPGEPRGW